ncbi:MAG: hypothetical protein ACKOAR_14125 [Bacteroidota bacterium]
MKTRSLTSAFWSPTASVTFLLAALLCTSAAQAQQFVIDRMEQAGDDLIIHYNLSDSVSGRSYTVNLYSSTDSYINPLTKVTGDLGLEVKPGGNRQIIWHAREELGATFRGAVSLEVRGKVYIPFVKMDGLKDYRRFKLRKTYRITWTGGRENQVLNFDLYKGERKVSTFDNIANVGRYDLRFDNVKPGRGYRFRISDVRNKDELVITDTFALRRKVPLLLKMVPLAAIALVWPKPGEEPIADPVKPGN